MKKVKYTLAGALIASLRRIKPQRKFVTAVILAAGSGTRMGADVTKQWLLLENEPLFVHSLRAFEECRHIRQTILVIKPDEKDMYVGIAERYGFKKLKAVVDGGDTRAASALNGFKKISDKTTHVAIHDAARCLITPQMISKVVTSAFAHGAAAAGCKSSDTVKVCTKKGFVESTPERASLRLAQTPQVFETEIYRASAYLAISDKLSVTDDCSLAEHAGFPVRIVDCGKENLKITEPVDLYFAEAVLKMRRDAMKK